MMPTSDNAQLRHWVYALLIVTSVAGVCGRIMSTGRNYDPGVYRAEGDVASSLAPWPKVRPEPTPTHGANDRSRWATVRALVDNGTYVVGHREFDETTGVAKREVPLSLAPIERSSFNLVELGIHVNLLPKEAKSLLAFAVSLISIFLDGKIKDKGIVTEDGWGTIDKVLKPDTHDFYSSKPPFLPTILAGEYWGLKRLFGWSIAEDRYWVIRTILVTVNALPFLAYLLLFAGLLEKFGQSDWSRLFLMATACFGTLISPFLSTLNNHTVAACTVVFALYPTVLDWRTASPSRVNLHATMAGFFASFTACNELPAASLLAGLFVVWALRRSWPALLCFVVAAAIPVAGFLVTNKLAIDRFLPAYGEFGGQWYEYEGSHWLVDPSKPKQGIDWASDKESRGVYAFHVLIGHHGLFSLTPVFVLAVAGVASGFLRFLKAGTLLNNMTWICLLTLALTLILLGFYIFYVPDRSRNYGGWAVGARWLLWLTPLLLLSAVPAADWLGTRRWGRWFGYVLLAVSVFSASYFAWNPWRHPWLYNLLSEMNWVGY